VVLHGHILADAGEKGLQLIKTAHHCSVLSPSRSVKN
jgi:hypothetical protein